VNYIRQIRRIRMADETSCEHQSQNQHLLHFHFYLLLVVEWVAENIGLTASFV
jgi:hypothetical protein